MKRLKIIVLFVFLASLLCAQEDYIKLKEDYTVVGDGQDIILFQSEIFKIHNNNQSDGIFIEYAEDSLFIEYKYYVKSTNGNFEPELNVQKPTNVIFQITKGGVNFYRFDLKKYKTENSTDKIFIAEISNKIQSVDKDVIDLKSIEFGNTLRLIIPGAPSFFYNQDEIPDLLDRFDANDYDHYYTSDDGEFVIYLNELWEVIYKENESKEGNHNIINFSNATLSKVDHNKPIKLDNEETLVYTEDGGWYFESSSFDLLEFIKALWLQYQWIIIVFLIFILLSLLFFLWLKAQVNKKHVTFLFWKWEATEVKDTFYDNSLNDFLKKHELSLKKLNNWNKNLDIPRKKYKRLSENERETLKNILHGKELVVDRDWKLITKENEPQVGYADLAIKNLESTIKVATLDHSKTIDTNKLKNEPIDKILKVFKVGFEEIGSVMNANTNSLISEIKNINDDTQLEVLQEKYNDLENKYKELDKAHELQNSTVKNQGETIQKLEGEKAKLGNELLYASPELSDYASSISAYFSFTNLVENEIHKALKKLSEIDLYQNEFHQVAQISSTFNSSIDKTTIEKWNSVFKDIVSDGLVKNSELIARLKNFDEPKEQLKNLDSFLFNKVWENYISCLLIATEEIKNIERYTQKPSEIGKELLQIFDNQVKDIIFKTKDLLGLDINYTELFEPYNKYGSFTKIIETNLKPYSKSIDILKLKRNDVIEIASFGFKSTKGFEKEQTKVKIKN